MVMTAVLVRQVELKLTQMEFDIKTSLRLSSSLQVGCRCLLLRLKSLLLHRIILVNDHYKDMVFFDVLPLRSKIFLWGNFYCGALLMDFRVFRSELGKVCRCYDRTREIAVESVSFKEKSRNCTDRKEG